MSFVNRLMGKSEKWTKQNLPHFLGLEVRTAFHGLAPTRPQTLPIPAAPTSFSERESAVFSAGWRRTDPTTRLAASVRRSSGNGSAVLSGGRSTTKTASSYLGGAPSSVQPLCPIPACRSLLGSWKKRFARIRI